ncbi:MAG: nickel-dependent lactate racemase [Pseudomonadota bacterium]
MPDFMLPFGKDHISMHLEEERVGQVLSVLQETSFDKQDQSDLVKAAINNPIGGDRLEVLARDAKTAVIIISDHTRPVPSKHIIPLMLSKLREGNPEIDITLLVATGFHRGTTTGELVNKLGEEIVATEKIVVHDCQDENMLVSIGKLPSGAELVVNRLAYQTDLLVSEGFIEPHFFAGFSGGRKSVLPGICSCKTIMGNHCAKFISNPFSRTGILNNNPINLDMWAAAKMVGLRFIVNVVINSEKEIVAAFAGDPEAAHTEGCKFLDGYCRCRSKRTDIVVTTNGGYPLDQNIYQCVKGMTAAEACCKKDGVIIIAGACNDGTGGESFYNAVKNCASAEELLAEIEKVPMEETCPDQWEYQILARILSKFTVIFVANPSAKQYINDMKMIYAETIDDALHTARQLKGMNAGITVIPDGVSVIIDAVDE